MKSKGNIGWHGTMMNQMASYFNRKDIEDMINNMNKIGEETNERELRIIIYYSNLVSKSIVNNNTITGHNNISSKSSDINDGKDNNNNNIMTTGNILMVVLNFQKCCH